MNACQTLAQHDGVSLTHSKLELARTLVGAGGSQIRDPGAKRRQSGVDALRDDASESIRSKYLRRRFSLNVPLLKSRSKPTASLADERLLTHGCAVGSKDAVPKNAQAVMHLLPFRIVLEVRLLYPLQLLWIHSRQNSSFDSTRAAKAPRET